MVLLGSLGFNTQPPEGGWMKLNVNGIYLFVSTHSRLKAAGRRSPNSLSILRSFNTQPPEGGWVGQKTRVVETA